MQALLRIHLQLMCSLMILEPIVVGHDIHCLMYSGYGWLQRVSIAVALSFACQLTVRHVLQCIDLNVQTLIVFVHEILVVLLSDAVCLLRGVLHIL
jgi:hypothetical protein